MDVSENKIKKVFVSYKDETDGIVKGYFDLIEISEGFIIIRGSKNVLYIPTSRVLKIKEAIKDDV